MKYISIILCVLFTATTFAQKQDYKKAMSENSVQSYLKFIIEHPTSKYSDEIDGRLKRKIKREIEETDFNGLISSYLSVVELEPQLIRKLRKRTYSDDYLVPGEFYSSMLENNNKKTVVVDSLLQLSYFGADHTTRNKALKSLCVVMPHISVDKLKRIDPDDERSSVMTEYSKYLLKNEPNESLGYIYKDYYEFKEYLDTYNSNLNSAENQLLNSYLVNRYFNN
jgi:hypothetical protein